MRAIRRTRAPIASSNEKKTVEPCRVPTVFRSRKGRMRWAEGFIAADWGTTNRRAYLIDADGQMRRRVRGRQGHHVGPEGRLFGGASRKFASGSATGRSCLPEWSGRTADGSKRPMSPARPVSKTSPPAWSGPRTAAPRSFPGVSFVDPDEADVMRGEEVQLLGAFAAGMIPARRARLPSRHAQQMGAARRWTDQRVSGP